MCHFRHSIILDSFSQYGQSDRYHPVQILFISTKSLVYNVPFQAFHHIRFFPTARTYIIYIYILSISTKSLFIMWPFRCFVLIDCFPHQGHWDKYKIFHVFFIFCQYTSYHMPIQVFRPTTFFSTARTIIFIFIYISVQTMQFHLANPISFFANMQEVQQMEQPSSLQSSKLQVCLRLSYPPISSRLLQGQSSKIFNHQVANKASMYFSNFSCPPTLSGLFQDPQFCKILNHQVTNNAGVSFLDPSSSSISSSLLHDPQSSKILTNQIAINAIVSLINSSYLPDSSKILNIKQQTMLVCLFKLLLSSNLVPAHPRTSLLQDPYSSKILNHQVANNASFSFLFQTPHILQSRPCSSKILTTSIIKYQTMLVFFKLLLSRLCSSKILTRPRSSLVQDPHSSKILKHQVANNASLFQTPPILQSRPCSSKILKHQVANSYPPISYSLYLFSEITVSSKLLISSKSKPTFNINSSFHFMLCNQCHFVLCKQ